jgi:hypothetical protein
MQRVTKKKRLSSREALVIEQSHCVTIVEGAKTKRFSFAPVQDDDLLPAILKEDFLTTFASPFSREEFFQTFWEKRALLVRGNEEGAQRLDDVILSEYLCDLDIEQLVNASPSDEIHVWVGSGVNQAAHADRIVRSLKCDTSDALSFHRKGASLYFRAPQPLADALLSCAMLSIGAAATGWQPDGSMRAEIETFVSKVRIVRAVIEKIRKF